MYVCSYIYIYLHMYIYMNIYICRGPGFVDPPP